MEKHSILWRRLDVPGHDSCQLLQTTAGWSLQGATVFQHRLGPAAISYWVALDHNWRTLSGRAQGYISGEKVDDQFDHDESGWHLNGKLVSGLEGLADLDFSFTPATNLQQLRRVNLAVGGATDLPVAWFDIDTRKFTKLPQSFIRVSATEYFYQAPTVPYEAVLELGPHGFVAHYPGLWKIEQ